MRTLDLCVLAAALSGAVRAGAAAAQEAEPSAVPDAVPRFPILPSPIELHGPSRGREYVGVTGPRSAWLGREDGTGEVWVHPLKVARDIRLAFQVPEVRNPIAGSALARAVTVRPELTTITYSHPSFTVRQHVLAPNDEPGILILLEVDAARRLEVVVEFEPVLQLAWPGAFGGQYMFWEDSLRAFVLSESLRTRHAVVGSPWATEATAHPAHRLSETPATFRVVVDSARAAAEFIPIALAAGTGPREEVLAAYDRLLGRPESMYRAKRAWADSVLATTTALDTPDDDLDLALEWAKVNLEEQRVCNPDLGCGFVAGWGPSGASFRPGFGWFFGGDAAMNTLAMDVTGQWALVAEDLRFLARYQRADGKIPHEISQAAARIPWFEEYPYAYYHADTTPWWMVAVWQYWKASGDDDFVEEMWPAFRRAWEWCLSVETDGDGLIENSAGGLAAVEVGEIGAGVHQDVYLASVWTAALGGALELARRVADEALAEAAEDLASRAHRSLNARYWSPDVGHHAFAVLQSGATSDELTAWPGVGTAFGLFDGESAESTLRRLARGDVSTEWGARMLSSNSDLYDPLQYNSGTVWPFVTGFVSLGQYTYRRPWSGYPLLDAIKQMTFDWSLGRHPELLSGAFYSPLDEAVPHQFFASSMLPTTLIRGLVGWEPDAPHAAAVLAPQLPAHWGRVTARNLFVGATRVEASVQRGSGWTRAEVRSEGPPVELTWVASLPPGARDPRVRVDGAPVTAEVAASRHDAMLRVPLTLDGGTRRVDVEWAGGLEVQPPAPDLEAGQRSAGLRVVDFGWEGGAWRLGVEGEAGRTYRVVLHGTSVHLREPPALPEAAPRGGTPGAAIVRSGGDGVTEVELTLPATDGDRGTLDVVLEEERR